MVRDLNEVSQDIRLAVVGEPEFRIPAIVFS